MSLRRSFLVFAAVLAVIGTGVAIALIILTTNLHRAAEEVGIEVESLHTGEELELELISLREETDPLAYHNILISRTRAEVLNALPGG